MVKRLAGVVLLTAIGGALAAEQVGGKPSDRPAAKAAGAHRRAAENAGRWEDQRPLQHDRLASVIILARVCSCAHWVARWGCHAAGGGAEEAA